MSISYHQMGEPNGSRKRSAGLSRRGFLKAAGQSATAAAVLGSQASAMRVFSQRGGSGPDDYKALVCVFLFGGADSVNLLVPRSIADYNIYATARGDLAETRGSLLPIQPLTPTGVEYGLHGAARELQVLFETGQMSFVANMGPLIRPVTQAEIMAGTAPTPQNLFSHSDQQAQWQNAHADGPGTTGWGGRMLDHIANASPDPLSPGIAIDLTGQLLTGAQVQPYTLAETGTESLALNGDPDRRAALDAIMTSSHEIGSEFARIQRESTLVDGIVGQLLDGAPTYDGLFPDSRLGRQLKIVARMISIRAQLGVKRQVFFVSAGGFDTHNNQTAVLPTLFGDMSKAIGAFQGVINNLGEADRVTGFTHSEFGRTLTSNGLGSDHGWGGHSMVFGGAVRGQDIYGEMPDLGPASTDDFGLGRLIPKIGVDQFGATFAKWFGLSDPEIDLVVPNINNFATRDLGFFS